MKNKQRYRDSYDYPEEEDIYVDQAFESMISTEHTEYFNADLDNLGNTLEYIINFEQK